MDSYRKGELMRLSQIYGTGGGGDDYEPHEHRAVPHGTNFCETLAHILNACYGIGILAMPQAFKHAGLIYGFVCTLIISGICLYGIHILLRSQYNLCKKLKVPYLTYPAAMRAALMCGPVCLTKFAFAAQVLVDIFLITYQVGLCCAYIIFVAENMKKLIDYNCSTNLHLNWYIMMIFLPFLFLLYTPDMKWLAPFSLISDILTFITCGIILHYIFAGLPDFNEMEYFGTAEEFPLFIGTVLFALAAMGVITTVEKNMKTPSQFTRPWGVLNVAMAILTISYAGMGVLGYWRHPHDIKASITLNMADDDVAAQVIQGLYAVSIYISYALNGMVPVDIIWGNYMSYRFKDSRHPWLWEYLVRTLIVIATFLVAATIPLLGEIISLCGALCMSNLEIIFPAIIHMCVRWENLGRGKWVLISDLIMIILGLIGFLSGTYSSVRDIIKKLRCVDYFHLDENK